MKKNNKTFLKFNLLHLSLINIINEKNFICISIMGGIGDQIFQYSYAIYLKNKLNCKVHLDISYYSNKLNYNKFIFRLSNISKKNKLFLEKDISYLN